MALERENSNFASPVEYYLLACMRFFAKVRLATVWRFFFQVRCTSVAFYINRYVLRSNNSVLARPRPMLTAHYLPLMLALDFCEPLEGRVGIGLCHAN